MAHELAELLRRTVRTEAAALETFSGETAISAGGWSPKEELGHLIDSAANNHVRFVRAAVEAEFHGPTYAQDDWVSAHRYADMPWGEVVSFWRHYNEFLASLIENIPDEKLGTKCFVGTGEAVSLGFLIDDYVLHLQHHVDHLLGRAQVTVYPRPANLKT